MYDLVFFSSIEIVSFCLSTFLKPKTRYVFVDHAITAINKSKIKNFFWKCINKNVETVVMEEYISDFLKNIIKIKNKVWLLRYPLPKIDEKKLRKVQTDERIMFAPSESNDEEFILFLIENYNLIKNYKIVIKIKKQSFKSDNLEVFNTRIKDEDYYSIMKVCDYVLLPYASDYNYRVSGVFFKAVALNKKCLINGNNTLVYYSEKYPNTVISFKGYDEFFSVLERLKDGDNKQVHQELRMIKKQYSDEKLRQQLMLILNGGKPLK